MKYRPHKSKKCKSTGKTKYRSEKEANTALIRWWSMGEHIDIYDMHPYVCPDCGKYHYGHKSYYEKYLQKQQMQVNG